MPLIASVSGVRGRVGEDLTPERVARYAAAFGALTAASGNATAVLARDARTSGPMFAHAAAAGLLSVGCRVIDCGLVSTPTAQLAVEHHGAGGGIVITASHNPIEWNALKFIGPDGIFLDALSGERLLSVANDDSMRRVGWEGIGTVDQDREAVRRHLRAVLGLSVLDVDGIRRRAFTVALDCVRGVGGTIMPQLLQALGCTVIGMDLETDGRFPRPPEPVPENLGGLSALVRERGAEVGFAVDPDGDRLALTDERGTPIGEDYTVAFAVRTVLRRKRGPVVVNLSTSLAVDDAARPFDASVFRTPVGEANVARAMRERGAAVGGEGNGGVILPELHFGRDAPVAAALVLNLLAETGATVRELVAERPRYTIVKARAPRAGDGDALAATYAALEQRFHDATVDRRDGLRLAWSNRWLHVRPSGTEPIVRLIAEAASREEAEALVSITRELLGVES